ncbi:MAG: hypothetical protein ABI222_18355 [Opitutaceae bacterium]
MSSPNVDFQFDPTTGCLRVRALTRSFLFEKETVFQSIIAAIQSHPVKALFADLREVPGLFTFTERYQLGELAGQHLRGTPIAVLAREEQLDPDRIGRMVAQNRGANLEIFTEEAAAHAWLQKYLSPSP